ncbi:hypothetical protein PoB_007033800 [Plakobranchus ocellatus]|uniref:Uncharacterized protein n=1 Tax=Plakobranchus ocellatus TaxID=259542 RepID=A0AAV4DHS8_9GAST|nr:hypothetical protein PoB_007033800 [Plakobranchus ocellatus]
MTVPDKVRDDDDELDTGARSSRASCKLEHVNTGSSGRISAHCNTPGNCESGLRSGSNWLGCWRWCCWRCCRRHRNLPGAGQGGDPEGHPGAAPGLRPEIGGAWTVQIRNYEGRSQMEIVKIRYERIFHSCSVSGPLDRGPTKSDMLWT